MTGLEKEKKEEKEEKEKTKDRSVPDGSDNQRKSREAERLKAQQVRGG